MSEAGKVFLLGSSGGGAVAEVFQRVARELGGKRARVGFSLAALPSAGGEGQTRAFLKGALPEAEVARFAVDGEEGTTRAPEARAVVERADVLFFGGGDPVLVARRLVDAGADVWIRDARARGAICGGLSAGSIALGAFWGSWSDESPDEDPAIIPCVGVAADLVVDCHAEEDDWAELRTVKRCLGARGRGLRFAGIGHGCALIVSGGGAHEWIGRDLLLSSSD